MNDLRDSFLGNSRGRKNPYNSGLDGRPGCGRMPSVTANQLKGLPEPHRHFLARSGLLTKAEVRAALESGRLSFKSAKGFGVQMEDRVRRWCGLDGLGIQYCPLCQQRLKKSVDVLPNQD